MSGDEEEVLLNLEDVLEGFPPKDRRGKHLKRPHLLLVHSFNIHDLGSDSVDFYCYEETICKKGSDAVASMLSKHVMEVMPETVKEFFSDSCCV
ncbi:hypothetical protein RRG08_062253 [Elysia crispata]|uniref:Uncharacterized protein n=1 Tax=Elysia crispata TaxID=231223 RepID=A0AAE1CY80_9GAST|nr:hypothetical protein RRG08_062253 [Elysia crispata]